MQSRVFLLSFIHSSIPPITYDNQQKLGHEGLNNLLAAYEDKSAYALVREGRPGRPWVEGADRSLAVG